MKLDKLIYDIKEQVSAISDDRYLDDRYIQHLIGTARADFLRKMLAKKPGYATQGLEQDVPLSLSSVSRSIFPGLDLGCKVVRSLTPIPKLIYEGLLSSYYRIRSADILCNNIEVITAERANSVVFEFPVVYTFLDYQYHLYFILPNGHQELKYAVLTGIFENPEEVDPTTDLEDYPINMSDWNTIKPLIVRTILGQPLEDPLNNSEEDLNVRQNVK